MPNELTTQPRTELERREPANMLEAVMQAVRDPSIDPARLKEFLEIGRSLEADKAKMLYNQAWAEMAPELPFVAENGVNTFTGAKYAKWDDIHRACMPVLRRFGFAVSFDSRKDGEALTVSVIITHSGGHQETRSFTVPWLDKGKAKSPADEAASALTKAQRHAFRKAFNILSIGEEERAAMGERITEDQAMRLADMLAELGNLSPDLAGRYTKWLKTEYGSERIVDLFQGEQYAAADKYLQAALRKAGGK